MDFDSLPDDAAQQAPAPQGIPSGQPQTFDKLDDDSETYGTPTQQAITGLEGAAQGVAGPLAPMAEKALGVDPEAIKARQAENPITHGLGEAAGLAGSMVTGVGEGALLAKGAGAITEAAGISSRVGSAAVKAALENVGVGSSDETTKMVLGDPNQTAQTALVDVGLAGLLGGALGAGGAGVSALWKSARGGQTGSILKAISDKAGGIDGVMPDTINDAIETSGMNVAPEVKAAFSADPSVQHMFKTLQESATGSGLEAQQALRSFKSDLGDQVVRALGKTPEEVSGLSEMSDYDAGANLKKALADTIKSTTDPISEAYEGIKGKFKNTPLSQADIGDIATKIGEMSSGEGYNLSPSSPQSKLVSKILEELPNLKTLEDARKYMSVIGDTTSNPEMYRLGGKLRGIFRDVEENTLDKAMGDKAPELVGQHQAAKAAYKSSMDSIDALNDRLHVGRYNGPASFIKALKDMPPEDILRRLSPKGDAGIIGELSDKFPQVAEQLKDYHLSQILKNASSKAVDGQTVNAKTLFTSLSKLSPEMRQFLMPGDVAGKVGAFESLLDGLPARMNNSGTAKTIDALMNHLPGSAIGLLSAAAGHGVGGFLLAPLVKALGRDVPDAIRLATLKFLGSSKQLDSVGFKSMTDYIHNAVRGQSLLTRATKALFTAGKDVLPESFYPTEKDRLKLDKYLLTVQQDPTKLTDISNTPGSYMPEHGTALSQTAMQAANYLNSLRPKPLQQNPLDTKAKPSSIDKAKYNRALDIAQQPLVVLNKIGKGTVLPSDVEAIRIMYPALYTAMSGKITQQVVDAVNKGNQIPYKTRLGLSMFLGTHLDSTLDAQSIMATQATRQPAQQPQGPAPMGGPKTKGSTKALNKFSAPYMTPSQTSEQRRAGAKD